MKAKVLYIFIFLSCLNPATLDAQFYTQGSDPARLRWSEIRTANYRVVYPAGLDSLAGVYAGCLENVREAVGSGIGMLPNGNYRRPMPVILHAESAVSNGMVTWTPRRMELFTIPDTYFPESTLWTTQLVVHESRHLAQMQLGSSRTFRWLKYPFGELVDGALAAIYGGPVFFEGDAVVTETALTQGGRGRCADFLEYQRICFDEGDMRNYWRWLYGSIRYYTPSHYTIGYMLNAGARTLYGEPDFTKLFYDRVSDRHGFAFFNTQNTVKQLSGKKFNDSFADISSHFQTVWEENRVRRAPFMPADEVLVHEKQYEKYSRMVAVESALVALRSGMSTAPRLVSVNTDGRESFLSPSSGDISRLRYDPVLKRIYWSEYKTDVRWEMSSSNDIRYRDADGRVHTIVKGRRCYNPVPSPNGREIAVVEFPMGGMNRIVLFSPDGEEIRNIVCPAGMQLIETVWIERKLYVSAVTKDGIGIYDTDGFTCVLAPQRSKIGDLDACDGNLLFVSDRNGVTELYALRPGSGRVRQLSSTRNGGHDFVFVGDSLYYAMGTSRSVNIYRTALSDLLSEEVDFSERYEDPIAAELSRGERVSVSTDAVEISQPKHYSKIAHLINVHSWAPLFVKYDELSGLAFDDIFQNVGLGATVFFQNELGSAYGSAGYHFQPGKSRHSGFMKFTYRGWYPVMEASIDVNTRDALLYRVAATTGGYTFKAQSAHVPAVMGSIRSYIPLSFSSGGWHRGIIPQINFSCTNDSYGRYASDKSFIHYSLMSRLTASVRAYTMLRTPKACIYPRWGIGTDIGWSTRPFMDNIFCDNGYVYLYGYVPGILSTHGIRLGGTFVHSPSGAIFAQETINSAPRGFSASATSVLGTYSSRNKLSVDYAMPFASLDWSGLCPVAYVRNLELIAHADYSFFSASKSSGSLYSVGADLCVRLGNLFWLPYDTRIGVSYNYNGGPSFGTISERTGDGHHSLSLVFSIEM